MPSGTLAILTTGYSAGQILGPLVVTPLLRHGCREALLVSAAVVALAAIVAAVPVTASGSTAGRPGPAQPRAWRAGGHVVCRRRKW